MTFPTRLLQAEKLIARTITDIQALLNAIDESEMSNEQAAVEKLRRLLPKLAAYMGEI
jgi:hypothetical protein